MIWASGITSTRQRRYVMGFYAGTAVAIAALSWLVAWYLVSVDRDRRFAEGREYVGEMVGLFERDTSRILNLAAVVVLEARRHFLSGGIPAVSAFSDLAFSEQQTISHITIADRDGIAIFVSGRDVQAGTSIEDRSYFRQMLENPNLQSLISLPYFGRNTGRLTVRLVHRIDRPDGSFSGVIFAAIPVDQFTAFFTTLNLGPNSSATLVGTDDKRIRARSSYGRLGPGQDISGSRLWSELEMSDVGMYNQTSVVDGVTRLYGYRKVGEHPLVVAIGLAEEDMLSDASAFARQLYTLVGLVNLVIGALTVLIWREVETRHRMGQEIVDRTAAEECLEQANEELRQHAYSASHDLKAPLSSIRGLLELSIEDLEDRDLNAVRANLEKAREIARRNAQKIENLLSVARSGASDKVVEELSLASLVEDVWQDQTASAACGIGLDLDLGVDRVLCDRSSLQIVLQNLIGNAIRYHDGDKAAPHLRVTTSVEGDDLRLVVSDNGVGIAEEFQTRIFDSFASFDDRGGDGLGLSLVRKHVTRLGGTVSVKSALGEGTSFTIVLPMQERDSHESAGNHRRRQRDGQIHHTQAA